MAYGEQLCFGVVGMPSDTDTADKNCPVLKEIGLHMLVREKLSKLDFFDWLLTLVIFQPGS